MASNPIALNSPIPARTERADHLDRAQTRDYRRTLQLGLALIWLVDGVLQLQPFMFTPGANGFSGMLAGTASGNPSWVARSITWDATLVDHHAVALNSLFALIQIAIGLGIAIRPTVKPALALSIAWSAGVWWFGEGLGGVLHGAGTPFFGGPGAVLFYALLAVLLWPADRSGEDPRFIAARAVGQRIATAIWLVVWVGLAVLSIAGSGRSSAFLSGGVQAVDSGEPAWLASIDRHAISIATHQGGAWAVVLAVICLVVAVGIFLPVPAARATLVLAVATFAVIWVVTENFGMILAGGATDPNSGPLVILLALAYWPVANRPRATGAGGDPGACEVSE